MAALADELTQVKQTFAQAAGLHLRLIISSLFITGLFAHSSLPQRQARRV